jgi:hypothetical protein
MFAVGITGLLLLSIAIRDAQRAVTYHIWEENRERKWRQQVRRGPPCCPTNIGWIKALKFRGNLQLLSILKTNIEWRLLP